MGEAQRDKGRSIGEVGVSVVPHVLDFNNSDHRDQIQIKYKLNMNSLFDLYLINLNKMGNPEGTTSFTMVYLGLI